MLIPAGRELRDAGVGGSLQLPPGVAIGVRASKKKSFVIYSVIFAYLKKKTTHTHTQGHYSLEIQRTNFFSRITLWNICFSSLNSVGYMYLERLKLLDITELCLK